MRLDLDFVTQYINPFLFRLYKLVIIFFVVQHFLGSRSSAIFYVVIIL